MHSLFTPDFDRVNGLPDWSLRQVRSLVRKKLLTKTLSFLFAFMCIHAVHLSAQVPCLTASASPESQAICNSNTITTIVFSSDLMGTTFDWTRDNAGTVTGIAASGSGDISGTLTNTTNTDVLVSFTVIPTNGACVGDTVFATVLVAPTATVNPLGNLVVCNQSLTAPVTFSGAVATTEYNWTNDNTAIGLAATGTGNIASFMATNATASPIVANITVTPSTTVGVPAMPELFYYRFDGSGTNVPNLAVNPPMGTANATIEGAITQGGSAICDGTLIGSNGNSSTDFVNTGWVTDLTGTSWTISFKTANITPSSTLWYIFGDANASGFRCFTNGVAGANNWILRGGGITDVLLTGGATVDPHTCTFVYDMPNNQIRAYLDGVLVNTVAQGALNILGPGPFKVGGYGNNSGLNPGGFMDEFQIYNRALPVSEVEDLAAGCISGVTCAGNPETFSITVNPATVSAIAVSETSGAVTNDNTVCAGEPATLTASGGGTYLWSTGATTAVITVTPGSQTTYTVTVTDINNCTSTASATINVVSGPAASITIMETSGAANDDGVICAGASATLTATGGTNYLWSNGDITPSIIVSPNATTTYTVSVTDSNVSAPVIYNFTGGMQTYTVPAGVTSLMIQAWGAQGANGAGANAGLGANGGEATGTLAVTPGQVLNLYVGGAGNGVTGGFNGGANGGNQDGGGGGGASDIRVGGTASSNRVIVAGGGGGGGTTGCVASHMGGNGGVGGGGAGVKGVDSPDGGGGFGGTVGAGGAAGIGCGGFLGAPGNSNGAGGNGQTCCCPSIPAGGGGGGGYVNGGGGGGGSAGTVGCSGNNKGGGGGGAGGSNFVDVTLTNTAMNNGIWLGNGQIILTPISLANGCITTVSTTITVNPLPTPAVAVAETSGTANNDGILCAGASATLTASGGATYSWSTGATTAAITVTPGATTTYNVTVTSAAGCNATSSSTITVNPLPTPAIAVAETSGSANNDGQICVSASVTLTASGGTSYAWSTGASTAGITVTPASTTTYTVTVTNANGCSATSTSTITVNPIPTPAIAVAETSGTTNNDGILCAGASATLTASGGASYTWSTGATTAAITVTPGATTTYNVTVTSAAGCSATSSSTITVNPLPTPATTVAETSGTTNNDGIICAGPSATITATGGTAYVWSTGAATAAITVSPAVTTTYTVTVTNANGCSATSTRTITVNPLPTAFAVTGGGGYCLGTDPGTLVGLSGSVVGVNYQLQRGGVNVGAPVAGTGNVLSFGLQTVVGTYTVVGTSVSTNCSNNMTGSVTIFTFNCTPSITDPCVCKNNATNLTNGQFDETIQVNAPSNQIWMVLSVNGLYSAFSPAPPAVPTPITVGTVLTPSGVNAFQLKGIHVDALGYSLVVTNNQGTTLSIGNSCQYPNPAITADLSGDFCLYSDVVNLTGTPGDANIASAVFTVNGVVATQFNPGAGVGQYTIEYTVNGGTPKAAGPNDPGCIQKVSTIVNVIATPAQLACNDLVYLSLDVDCVSEINPDDILEGSYGCYDDYVVELRSVIDKIKSPDYSEAIKQGDIEIYFKPMTYKNLSDNNKIQFDEQRIFQSIPTDGNVDTQQIAAMSQALKKMTEMTVMALSQSIQTIKTPQAMVSEPEYISEFMKNCDRGLFNRIQEYVIGHKTQAEMQPVNIKCGQCENEYKQNITLDMTSFFGPAS